MIHTMTISTLIPSDTDTISAVLSALNLPPELIETEFNPAFNPEDTSTHHRTAYPKYPGVKNVKLVRSTHPEGFWSAEHYESSTSYSAPENVEFPGDRRVYLPAVNVFSLSLELNPYKVLHPEEKHTINLFIPVPKAVTSFTEAFVQLIETLFGSLNDYDLEALKRLRCWNMRRIDYSFNLQFPDDNTRAIFQKLTHKTSRHLRTKKVSSREAKLYEQSAAEKNNSYKAICYDKSAEIQKQDYIDADEKRTLLSYAYGVQRFELQITHNGLASFMERHNLHSRCFLNFLNLDIAYQELQYRYKQTIGFEDFYDRQQASAIIRAAYKPGMAIKLINLLQLIAQARGIDAARKQYIGKGGRIKIGNLLVKGTADTFNSHITKIRAAGINPVLLTDRDKLSHLDNPIQQINTAYLALKND